ncbi:MAG: J domain-containing protein [Acidimicrobiia bacterium]|nr:J domain-containing protein [Acidimicrobiia bacterium]
MRVTEEDLNWYGILGVDPGAPEDEIRARYRELAKEHHPDRGGSADAFRLVREAWDVLGDPQTRASYDYRRRAKLEAEEANRRAAEARMADTAAGSPPSGAPPHSDLPWFLDPNGVAPGMPPAPSMHSRLMVGGVTALVVGMLALLRPAVLGLVASAVGLSGTVPPIWHPALTVAVMLGVAAGVVAGLVLYGRLHPREGIRWAAAALVGFVFFEVLILLGAVVLAAWLGGRALAANGSGARRWL